jgi:hypothetical protein
MNLKKIIDKILGRSDIVENDGVYMKRWRIIHTPWFGLRVHNIVRSDQDRELHDHPFWFISLVLKGGYIEETPDGLKKYYGPGSVLMRSAAALHRLDLTKNLVREQISIYHSDVIEKEVPAWTLVIRGPKVRQWGFLTPDGWVPSHAWRKYIEARDNRRTRETA